MEWTGCLAQADRARQAEVEVSRKEDGERPEGEGKSLETEEWKKEGPA